MSNSKKIIHILLQVSIILFLKTICIDHLFEILLNTELTISYNFVQGWLMALTNTLIYYFYYLIFIIIQGFDLIPIPNYKVFKLNFSIFF